MRKGEKKPVYFELKNWLRTRIDNGELRPGDCIRSEHLLAAEFGISRPSVRKAIGDFVREGLVQRMPGKGTFVADPEKNKPLQDSRRVISFIVPDVQTPFIGQICRGMLKAAEQHDFIVAVYGSDWEIDKENKNILLTMARGECGTIIFPNWGRNNYSEILKLKKEGFPFVLIDNQFKELQTDYVGVDNFTGAFEAVEHLIKLGHTSIAHVMGMPGTSNEARLEGYRQALLSHGLPVTADNIKSIAKPEYSYREPHQSCGHEEARALMQKKDRPTAIFTGSDFIGLGVLQGLKSCGLSVPEDVAVVSFDDLEWAAWPDIQLTTVAQPKEEIGIRAAELLIEKIESKSEMPKQVKHIILPTKLIIRKTCGAKSATENGSSAVNMGEKNVQLAVPS